MKRRPPVVIIRKRSATTKNEDSPRTSRKSSGRSSRDGDSSSSGGSGAAARSERKPSRGGEKNAPSGSPSRGGTRNPPKRKQAKGVDAEKLARRKAATELAEAAGIPIAYAHRILQGQTTLKDVTQKLMRKAKLEALVRDEALDPSLAGQVAAGKLKLERARVINKMRQLRPHSVSKDGFHLAQECEGPVALQCFGGDWIVGKVAKSDVYELDFETEKAGEVHRIVKHDVKMVVLNASCPLDELIGIDQDVASQGLEGTGEVTQRIKVPQDFLLETIGNEGVLSLVCRDGATVRGQVVCFSRWDIELRVTPLTGGEPVSVIVFNHALHPQSAATQS